MTKDTIKPQVLHYLTKNASTPLLPYFKGCECDLAYAYA